MRRTILQNSLCLALALSSAVAFAQGGSCKDPWINQAFNQMYQRAPAGSGLTGECDTTRYGNGHWTTFQDLEAKISAVVPSGGSCKDPWINQAFNQMYRRPPNGSGTTGECDTTRYGGGHWTTLQDLETKIAQAGTGGRPAPEPVVAPNTRAGFPSPNHPGPAPDMASGNGLISDAGGNGIAKNATKVISNDGGSIISQDGSGIISQDGNGARSLNSVDKPRAPAGKYLVIPGGNLVDANGNVLRKAGTYTLLFTGGRYTVGSGAGARTPVAGTIVTP